MAYAGHLGVSTRAGFGLLGACGLAATRAGPRSASLPNHAHQMLIALQRLASYFSQTPEPQAGAAACQIQLQE